MTADGDTFVEARDGERLSRLTDRVWTFMADGEWHTLTAIARTTLGTEASVSARLRDFRKARFGSHTVERRYLFDGLWQYRVVPNVAA